MDDRRTQGPVVRDPVPATARRLAVFAVALAVAVVVAPIPTLTWQATAVTALIGLPVVALVATGRPARVGGAKQVTVRTAAPWIVLWVAFAVLELAALALGSRPELPTISHLLGPEFVDSTVRLVGYVAWLCGGYWLVRR